MKKDHGGELLRVLSVQRSVFIRLSDGTRQITNPVLYRQMEEEAFRLQQLIGLENKRRCPELKEYSKKHKECSPLCQTY